MKCPHCKKDISVFVVKRPKHRIYMRIERWLKRVNSLKKWEKDELCSINLGEIIRQRRNEIGLKVYELANKVGVNPVYITQIEKHNKFPSISVIKKIAEVLNKPRIVGVYMQQKTTHEI